MVEDKARTVEKELEEKITELEQNLLSGKYSEAFKSLQKAKALTHIIKVGKYWNRGNKFFALISETRKVREAFESKRIKELEESLNRIENLLLR